MHVPWITDREQTGGRSEDYDRHSAGPRRVSAACAQQEDCDHQHDPYHRVAPSPRQRRLSCTLTAAVSTPARSWRGSPAGTIGPVQSGALACAWENAAAESFCATLKVEFYDRHLGPTRTAAKFAVGDWIERIYNRRRHHLALGMLSPAERLCHRSRGTGA